MKKSRQLFLAHTLPGFEAIASDEIATVLEGARVRGTRSVAEKNSMVLFDYAGDAEDLLALRRNHVGGLFTLFCKNVRKVPQFFGSGVGGG